MTWSVSILLQQLKPHFMAKQGYLNKPGQGQLLHT